MAMALPLLFNGCGSFSSSSPEFCINNGYNGVALSTIEHSPQVYCSNGDFSPNGEYFVTNFGNKSTSTYTYLEFKDIHPTK